MDSTAGSVRKKVLGRQIVKERYLMKWFINSMLGYWILLLAISLSTAAIIYELWLKGNI